MGETTEANQRRGRAHAVVVLAALVLAAIGTRAHAADAGGRIEGIRLENDGAATKVVIALSRPLAYDVHVLDGDATRQSARRLVLDFQNTTLAPDAAKPIDVANPLLRQIRPGQFNARTARIVLDLASDATHAVDASDSPPRVTIALAASAAAGAVDAGATEKAAATAPVAASDTLPAEAPSAAQKPSSAAADAANVAPAAAGSDAPKQPVRQIPIRARGRRPYSLIYSR